MWLSNAALKWNQDCILVKYRIHMSQQGTPAGWKKKKKTSGGIACDLGHLEPENETVSPKPPGYLLPSLFFNCLFLLHASSWPPWVWICCDESRNPWRSLNLPCSPMERATDQAASVPDHGRVLPSAGWMCVALQLPMLRWYGLVLTTRMTACVFQVALIPL